MINWYSAVVWQLLNSKKRFVDVLTCVFMTGWRLKSATPQSRLMFAGTCLQNRPRRPVYLASTIHALNTLMQCELSNMTPNCVSNVELAQNEFSSIPISNFFYQYAGFCLGACYMFFISTTYTCMLVDPFYVHYELDILKYWCFKLLQFICLWVYKVSEGVLHMADNSQNGPTVHFSQGISRMHGKLCNILTRLPGACHFSPIII